MCKDAEIPHEEDEESETRDCEVQNRRGGGIGDTSSDSGHSVDQRGYLSEYEDQVPLKVDMLFQFHTIFLSIFSNFYFVMLKIWKKTYTAI